MHYGNGRESLAHQTADQREHLKLVLHVEPRCRFVEQEQPRLLGERAGQEPRAGAPRQILP